jgi:cytochrome c peroxidase
MIVVPQVFDQESQADSNLESLGELIFFNPELSVNGTQLCASYLMPEAG